MKKFILSISFLIFLTNCSGDVKSSLGLTKQGPDEFTIISYPPLSAPPEFSLNQPSIDKRALPQRNSNSNVKYSSEESILLGKISTSDSKSLVKEPIENEASRENNSTERHGFIRSTISSLNPQNGNKDPIIDQEAEKERISKNIQEGKAINEGEVKSTKPKSFFSNIFGG